MKRIILSQALWGLLIIAGLGLFIFGCQNEELPIVTYPEHSLTSFSPGEGRPGETVIITGTNFGEYAPAVSVSFNGAPAEVLALTNTQIETRVPNEGVSGPITVDVWTHSKTTTEVFTVIPGAKVLSLSPATGSAGDQISILGESFGTDPGIITVYFSGPEEPIAATIASVAEEEIVVNVPNGGVTGPITVVVGPQSLTGPIFEYPVSSTEFLFAADGDTEGWTSSHNSTNEVGFGVMKVSFDMSATRRRADFAHTGGMTVHAGAYPIVAIRLIDKPASGNLIFDTNLGKYKDGSNNWEGVLDDNVYYYDLRNTFGADNNLSQTAETMLTTFQWKVADITTDETGYFVDWVKTFASVSELEAYVATQNIGQHFYGFSGPNRTVTLDVDDDWTGRPDQSGWSGPTVTTVEDGYCKVTFANPSDGVNKNRADFTWSFGGDWGSPGSGIDKEPWLYTAEFPIYAIKVHFIQPDGSLGGPRPGAGNIFYDRLGQFNDDYADQGVLWVNASDWAGGEASREEGSWWQIKVADVLTEESAYWVDWHRTFRSLEELEFYLND